MNKRLILVVLSMLVVFAVGLIFGFAASNITKTVDTFVEPKVGSIVYLHPELAETQNSTKEYLGERLYGKWEPAVIVKDFGSVVRVRFCSDGYETDLGRGWLSSYRLTNKTPSYEFCTK